jgi:threonylcarbamoyladenosine tRNA methylthiotransferase MtaB
MRTFSIDSLGCKVNQYDGQQIREFLLRLGLRQVENRASRPDLAIVNTCCVTNSAEAKSRRSVRRAQRLNPSAAVVVCGCLPAVQGGEMAITGPNLLIVKDRQKTGAVLRQIAAKGEHSARPSPSARDEIFTEKPAKIMAGEDCDFFKPLSSFSGHTRAFLKVQDGCDGRCSYCIVPATRPRVHSKPPGQVLDEASSLVDSGHREIVIVGICLGAYGRATVMRRRTADRGSEPLADLLEQLARLPGLERIRLGSLEPADVTDRLLEVLGSHDNIMPHLHLSVQSGSDAVLRRMCRQYRAADLLRVVDSARSALDRPALTADMIVGFPGETREDFERTVATARYAGFAKMHVFTYSSRPGTQALRLAGKVEAGTAKARSEVLRRLDKELGRSFRSKFVGEKAVVLVEQAENRVLGRCERYFTVEISGAAGLQKNDLVDVEITAVGRNTAAARIS